MLSDGFAPLVWPFEILGRLCPIADLRASPTRSPSGMRRVPAEAARREQGVQQKTI
jgi:hypothetical protein